MAMTLFSPIPTTERKVAESAPLSSINPERTGSGSGKNYIREQKIATESAII